MDLVAQILVGYGVFVVLFFGYLVWETRRYPIRKTQWEQTLEAERQKTQKGEDEICFGNPD